MLRSPAMIETPIARVGSDELAAYVTREEPCVVAGGARAWPAMQWTAESLAARIGELAIRCKVSATHVHPNFGAPTLKEAFATEATTFRELFASFAGLAPAHRLFTGDEQFVLRVRDGVTTVHEPLRALLDDVVVPEVARERLYTIWAWFSGRGVHTGLHYDNNGCHNLNAQLAGAKRCVLYPPSALPDMALFPIGGSNPAINCSSLDVETAPPACDRFAAQLAPGDLLFIPAWWFHAFWHLGDFNANMNVWWKPAVETTNPVAERQRAVNRA
jgi:cupin-like protein